MIKLGLFCSLLFADPYFEARLEDSKVHYNFILEVLQRRNQISSDAVATINKELDAHNNSRDCFYDAVDQIELNKMIGPNMSECLKKSWEDSFGYIFFPREICCTGERFHQITDTEEKRKIRARVYEETKAACIYGYRTTEKCTPQKIAQMQHGTFVVESLSPLEQLGKYSTTEVKVFKMDTIHLTRKLQEEGYRPVALNFANKNRVGGGVTRGAMAQEEELFRRSTYCFGLNVKYNAKLHKQLNGEYLIPEFGAIYTPHVEILRETESEGYRFIKPFEVDFIAAAGYNLSAGAYDAPASPENYFKGIKKKIKNILRLAVKTDHDAVVLGALGCGAFKNDPRIVATAFKDVLGKKEFQGQFKMVAFGILDGENDNKFRTFQEILEHPPN